MIPSNSPHQEILALVRALTWPYRISHAHLTEGLIATWAFGTLIGILLLLVLVLSLYFVLKLADRAYEAVFHALIKKAKYEDAKELSARFVSTQSRIWAVQGLAGVYGGYSQPRSTTTNPDISNISWWSVRILRVGSAIKTLLLSWIGAISILATLYVVRPPVIEPIVGLDWQDQLPDGIDVAATSLVLAGAAFALGRFATAKTRGHNDWRRRKAVQARDELAQLERSLSSCLPVLQSALKRSWNANPSLISPVRDRNATSPNRAQEEIKAAHAAASCIMTATKSYLNECRGKPNSIVPRRVRRPVWAAAKSCDYTLFGMNSPLSTDKQALVDAHLDLARLARAQAATYRYLYRPSLFYRVAEALRP